MALYSLNGYINEYTDRCVFRKKALVRRSAFTSLIERETATITGGNYFPMLDTVAMAMHHLLSNPSSVPFLSLSRMGELCSLGSLNTASSFTCSLALNIKATIAIKDNFS